jgi:5-methyltetrahydrofolate--homocysteine methyltransferase
MERFVTEDGLNLIGGCCGTNDAAYRRRSTRCCASSAARRAARAGRAQAASGCRRRLALHRQVPLRQENSYFSIGERCNANGSKAWRERQAKRGDWDGCVAIGREQVARGLEQPRHLHRLRRPRRDGRDERGDPPLHQQRERAAGDRFHRDAGDRGALKLHGGKPIINSINFEEGEGRPMTA